MMFIPYDLPNGDRRRTRRVINTFVAAKAVRRRRSIKSPGFNAGFITHWSEASHEESMNGYESPQNAGCVSMSSISQAGGKVARIGHIQRNLEEPLGSWALSYYFDVICQHDSPVLGHSPARAEAYSSTLFSWSAQYDLVYYGLVAFSLCCLIQHDASDAVHRATLHYRKRLLDQIHERLSARIVDDVLIYALSLLIPIDDYLENNEYSRAHAKGLRAIIQAIGGEDCIGESAPAMREAVILSALMARSLLLSHEPVSSICYSPISDLKPDLTSPENAHLNHPRGFMDLIQAKYVPPSMIAVLDSFSSWWQRSDHCHDSAIPMWRPSMPTSPYPRLKIAYSSDSSVLHATAAPWPITRHLKCTDRRTGAQVCFLLWFTRNFGEYEAINHWRTV
ncbi:hypothetical protein BJY04DRAFT_217468 [Aspergillus karnatakaensis]|uniref:uncharacterized protein n=1 Tax=Aspergillus karnatakaensis TaxID=1810916 RepID=UPI003CCCF934